jgi:hypothetical protein
MSIVLKMEDLTANALIEIIKDQREGKVSLKQIESYGNNIVKEIRNKGENAIIPITEYSINHFLKKYSDFFEMKEEGNESFIYLKPDKTIYDLRKSFRAYIPLDIVQVFSSKESLEALFGYETKEP